MTVQSTLKDVFDCLIDKDIKIILSESYCSGPKPDLKQKSGWICAAAQDNNRIMEDIMEEGSAEVTWHFGPPNKISTIASFLVKAFTRKGYIVKWNKNMGGQITAVIEMDDLPRSFLEKWCGNNSEDEDDEQSFIDKRIDPDADVLFNNEDEDNTNFSSDDESDEESDDESDHNVKTGLIIDPSSDEESDEESEHNVKTGLIIDPSSDEESDNNVKMGLINDEESDIDDTVCPKNCDCVNCKEELEK
jgi:hypothetical protein